MRAVVGYKTVFNVSRSPVPNLVQRRPVEPGDRRARLRFGIGREMPYTLEEIGRVMSLSRERVRQIEAAALKKIQQAEEQGSLREFLA